MKITAKTNYALQALMELALRWPDRSPLQVHDIARTQKIPERFLVQIMLSLKQLGYIDSLRGKLGGYRLRISPEKIEIGRLVKEMSGDRLIPKERMANREADLCFSPIWDKAENGVEDYLSGITLMDVIRSGKEARTAIAYEI